MENLMDAQEKDILLKARDILLKQLDGLERKSSHRPLTNAVLADYSDKFPSSGVKPVKGNIQPSDVDRRSLLGGITVLEKAIGVKHRTRDVLRWHRKKIT
jgi:hypothetical protein